MLYDISSKSMEENRREENKTQQKVCICMHRLTFKQQGQRNTFIFFVLFLRGVCALFLSREVQNVFVVVTMLLLCYLTTTTTKIWKTAAPRALSLTSHSFPLTQQCC